VQLATQFARLACCFGEYASREAVLVTITLNAETELNPSPTEKILQKYSTASLHGHASTAAEARTGPYLEASLYHPSNKGDLAPLRHASSTPWPKGD